MKPIKRKLSSFNEFKKTKKTLEEPKKHPIKEGEENNAYMFWQNLKTLHHAVSDLLKMDEEKVNQILENGHGWALDHIATSTDDVEEVYHFLEANVSDEKEANISEE